MFRQKPTFRIFISSTFGDMVQERNALQTRVFPKLKTLCEQHHAQFQAIDLRWGISEEAGLNQRALEVCLQEIARCQRITRRPNFLLLLGDRYGWRPLPVRILQTEFAQIERHIFSIDDRALLHQWYRCDDNAVPPVYVLQQRKGESIDAAAWGSIEQQLRTILMAAVDAAQLPPPQRLKYERSITEQEIAAGIFDHSEGTAGSLCFFRNIAPPLKQNSIFFDVDSDSRQRLLALKDRLRAYLPPESITEYATAWADEATIDYGYLAQFCDDVEASLTRMILSEIADIEKAHPVVTEVQQHTRFANERIQHFIGQSTNLANIQAALHHYAKSPIVVHGESGIGKSSLFARLLSDIHHDKTPTSKPAETLYRSIGITPASSDIRALLHDICTEISLRFYIRTDVPQGYDELVKYFPILLGKISSPLIILIDAVDQLLPTYTPQDLRWLPLTLPAQVRLVISTIPGNYLQRLQQRLPAEQFVVIAPMTHADGEQLLGTLLASAQRTLQPAQHAHVIEKFAHSRLPLYMKLAFEEAKLWHSYTTDMTLEESVPLLIEHNLFARLSRQSEHGTLLVSHALAFINAARHGLTEDEILDLLTQDSAFWSQFYQQSYHQEALNLLKQLPVVVWSRLYLDLMPYMIETSADETILLTFYHRQFEETVRALFVSDDTHAQLAQYFVAQPLYAGAHGNVRKISEQAYQQAHAGLIEQYAASLADYQFIEASLAYRGVESFLKDYNLHNTPAISSIRQMLRASSHIVQDTTQLPAQLIGWLREEATTSPLISALVAEAKLQRKTDKAIFIPHTDMFTSQVLDRTLNFDESINQIVCIDEDRALMIIGGQIRLWSLSEAREIQRWKGNVKHIIWRNAQQDIIACDHKHCYRMSLDNEQGEQLFTLKDHHEFIMAIRMLDDDTLMIANSKYFTVFDMLTRTVTQQIDNLPKSVGTEAAIAPLNAEQALVSSMDQDFYLYDRRANRFIRRIRGHRLKWDTPKQRVQKTLNFIRYFIYWGSSRLPFRGHYSWIQAIYPLKAGTFALGASSMDVKLWHLPMGITLRTLAKSANVNTIAIDKFIVNPEQDACLIATRDLQISEWTLKPHPLLMRRIRTYRGNAAHLVALDFNRQYVVAGTFDNTVKIWRRTTGRADDSVSLKHEGAISHIAVSANQQYAVSISHKTSMSHVPAGNMWSLSDGSPLERPEHSFTRTGFMSKAAAISPDGRYIATVSVGSYIHIYSISGRLLHQIKLDGLNPFSHDYYGLAISGDSQRVAIACNSRQVPVLALATGKLLDVIHVPNQWASALTMLPDGEHLVIAGDGEISIWHIHTMTQVHALMLVTQNGQYKQTLGTVASVVALHHSPAVLFALNKRVLIWEFASEKNEVLFTLSANVTDLAITHDDKYVVTASKDKTVRIWDIATRKCIGIFTDNDSFTACAIANGHIIAGTSRGMLHFLSINGLEESFPVTIPLVSKPAYKPNRIKNLLKPILNQLNVLHELFLLGKVKRSGITMPK